MRFGQEVQEMSRHQRLSTKRAVALGESEVLSDDGTAGFVEGLIESSRGREPQQLEYSFELY